MVGTRSDKHYYVALLSHSALAENDTREMKLPYLIFDTEAKQWYENEEGTFARFDECVKPFAGEVGRKALLKNCKSLLGKKQGGMMHIIFGTRDNVDIQSCGHDIKLPIIEQAYTTSLSRYLGYAFFSDKAKDIDFDITIKGHKVSHREEQGAGPFRNTMLKCGTTEHYQAQAQHVQPGMRPIKATIKLGFTTDEKAGSMHSFDDRPFGICISYAGMMSTMFMHSKKQKSGFRGNNSTATRVRRHAHGLVAHVKLELEAGTKLADYDLEINLRKDGFKETKAYQNLIAAVENKIDNHLKEGLTEAQLNKLAPLSGEQLPALMGPSVNPAETPAPAPAPAPAPRQRSPPAKPRARISAATEASSPAATEASAAAMRSTSRSRGGRLPATDVATRKRGHAAGDDAPARSVRIRGAGLPASAQDDVDEKDEEVVQPPLLPAPQLPNAAAMDTDEAGTADGAEEEEPEAEVVDAVAAGSAGGEHGRVHELFKVMPQAGCESKVLNAVLSSLAGDKLERVVTDTVAQAQAVAAADNVAVWPLEYISPQNGPVPVVVKQQPLVLRAAALLSPCNGDTTLQPLLTKIFGSTVIVQSKEDAHAYRQSLRGQASAPTIAALDGTMLRSDGSFGGESNTVATDLARLTTHFVVDEEAAMPVEI